MDPASNSRNGGLGLDADMDIIKQYLTGKQPDYIRGYLDALRAYGKITDADVERLVSWATEAAIRRIVSGPIGEPNPSLGD